MKKIVIAYHVFMFGDNYMDLITEQLRTIMLAIHDDNGLSGNLFHYCSKMYIGVVDSPKKNPRHGIEWLRNFMNFTSSKQENGTFESKVEIVAYKDNLEETRTMMWIRDYAVTHPNEYVVYFHTKGITRNTPASNDWRKYMEYFVLDNWKDCITKLDEGYDCCGVMWNKDTPIGYHPHFSGTFWWATTNYINTLDHSFLTTKKREDREFWIGTNPNVKVFEFHNSGYNTMERLIKGQGHYNLEYPYENYVKEPTEDESTNPPIDMTLHVVITVFRRALTLRRLIDCFLLQTNPNWILHIIHDGPPLVDVVAVMTGYNDKRIEFTSTPQVNGRWGFPNRRLALKNLAINHRDYILFTNDDNDYVIKFVEYFLRECRSGVGLVHCDIVHSYQNYAVLPTQMKENYIDMGSFIVKLDVAKRVGINHEHEQADGTYAVECATYCRKTRLKIIHIAKPLFIHN